MDCGYDTMNQPGAGCACGTGDQAAPTPRSTPSSPSSCGPIDEVARARWRRHHAMRRRKLERTVIIVALVLFAYWLLEG